MPAVVYFQLSDLLHTLKFKGVWNILIHLAITTYACASQKSFTVYISSSFRKN